MRQCWYFCCIFLTLFILKEYYKRTLPFSAQGTRVLEHAVSYTKSKLFILLLSAVYGLLIMGMLFVFCHNTF
jgi:hypothetical protein